MKDAGHVHVTLQYSITYKQASHMHRASPLCLIASQSPLLSVIRTASFTACSTACFTVCSTVWFRLEFGTLLLLVFLSHSKIVPRSGIFLVGTFSTFFFYILILFLCGHSYSILQTFEAM